jgi:hypothetical protein
VAATPAGAWLIGPSQLACCAGRTWLPPVAAAFGLSLAAAMSAWALLWLLLPRFEIFHPICRAFLDRMI